MGNYIKNPINDKRNPILAPPDIEVPSLDVSDLDAPSFVSPHDKDLFAEKKRAAWKDVQLIGKAALLCKEPEARCDFAPNKVRISYRNPAFGIISLWKKPLYVRTLTDIKSDPDMVEKFAEGMNTLIRQIIGDALPSGDWCIVTSPKRRHKERNFAALVSAQLAELLGIPFHEDLVECHSRHRVGAVFALTGAPPMQRNVIVYDDFVTTGSTMSSMFELFSNLHYNTIFFTSINNKS